MCHIAEVTDGEPEAVVPGMQRAPHTIAVSIAAHTWDSVTTTTAGTVRT